MNYAWAEDQATEGKGKQGVCRIPWSKSRVRVSMGPGTHPCSRKEKKSKPLAGTVLDDTAIIVS